MNFRLLGVFCFFFWLCCEACRISVPCSGTEHRSPAVEVQSPNSWTPREFPSFLFKNKQTKQTEEAPLSQLLSLACVSYSFTEYLLSAYYLPGIVPEAWDTTENKANRNSSPLGAYFPLFHGRAKG